VASRMTEGLPPAALAQFEVLQRGFVAGLPARWLALETAATAQERQAVLHRLCGAAGSYGLERLSQCARAAEALALSAAPEALAPALALLKAEIERATACHGGPGCHPGPDPGSMPREPWIAGRGPQ